MLMQFGLPVPEKLGAGGYKAWIEAAKQDSALFTGRRFEGRCSLSVTYHRESTIAGDVCLFLAWARKALIEARVITEAQLCDGVGAWPDGRQEIPATRVRVTLIEEK